MDVFPILDWPGIICLYINIYIYIHGRHGYNALQILFCSDEVISFSDSSFKGFGVLYPLWRRWGWKHAHCLIFNACYCCLVCMLAAISVVTSFVLKFMQSPVWHFGESLLIFETWGWLHQAFQGTIRQFESMRGHCSYCDSQASPEIIVIKNYQRTQWPARGFFVRMKSLWSSLSRLRCPNNQLWYLQCCLGR